MAEQKRVKPIIRRQAPGLLKDKAGTCRLTFSSLPGLRFQTETKGFPSGGKEHPSRGQPLRRVTVIMNIFHERRTASGTTTALPFESNALEIEWRGVRFLVRIITKMCEAITSRVPVGHENETGFHFGVAEPQPVLIRTGCIPNRSPRESFLMRGGDKANVGFDSGGQSFFNRDVFYPGLTGGCRPNHIFP